jgi:hypothetical protein
MLKHLTVLILIASSTLALAGKGSHTIVTSENDPVMVGKVPQMSQFQQAVLSDQGWTGARKWLNDDYDGPMIKDQGPDSTYGDPDRLAGCAHEVELWFSGARTLLKRPLYKEELTRLITASNEYTSSICFMAQIKLGVVKAADGSPAVALKESKPWAVNFFPAQTARSLVIDQKTGKGVIPAHLGTMTR